MKKLELWSSGESNRRIKIKIVFSLIDLIMLLFALLFIGKSTCIDYLSAALKYITCIVLLFLIRYYLKEIFTNIKALQVNINFNVYLLDYSDPNCMYYLDGNLDNVLLGNDGCVIYDNNDKILFENYVSITGINSYHAFLDLYKNTIL